jgi:hypothetical protein
MLSVLKLFGKACSPVPGTFYRFWIPSGQHRPARNTTYSLAANSVNTELFGETDRTTVFFQVGVLSIITMHSTRSDPITDATTNNLNHREPTRWRH